MLSRPREHDLRLIGGLLGKVSLGLAAMMALPALPALFLREWNAATALLTGAGIALVLGLLADDRATPPAAITWAHGMVTVALAWLLGPVLAAIPFHLSGHTATFLDAWFEAMSGLTTTGLSVIADLDHLAVSLRLYRQLTQFVGGQGIVIVVLALFRAGGGASTLYVAEGRDDRVVPNIQRTARYILEIALLYLVVGTMALTIAVSVAGIRGWPALWHGLGLFFAAFDTGGFAPTSRSIGYYHSVGVEVVVMALMVAGSLAFTWHYRLLRGPRRGLWQHLEVRSLTTTLPLLAAATSLALLAVGTFTGPGPLWRRGVFTAVSAHTGTGYAVGEGALLRSDWGMLAPALVVVAMAFGGMAGSTTGGFKALRIGLAVKGFLRDARRLLLPESALVVMTYHRGRTRILTSEELQAATSILLLYAVTFLGGALVALGYDRWDGAEAVFESVSATANVGLSVGIVGPGMPVGLQLTYLLQMWLGRLEFVAAFALIGYAVALGRRRR